MTEVGLPRLRMCCRCICFRRAQTKSKAEEEEDASSIVFYRKFSDVWEEDSAEEEIVTCSQPLDDEDKDSGHEEATSRDYSKHNAGNRKPPVAVAMDSTSDITSWVETPDSGEQTELIGKSKQYQRMRDNRRLLTLPLRDDHYNLNTTTSPESECDELKRPRPADLSFSIDDSISNFMQSRVTMWTAASGLLTEDSNLWQDEVWSIHSDSAVLLRDYLFPNEDWQASLDSYGSDLDLNGDEDGEDENGNADNERTKILEQEEENGNRYFKKSPMSLPGDAYRPLRTTYDIDVGVHSRHSRNRNRYVGHTQGIEVSHAQGIKRKESLSSPEEETILEESRAGLQEVAL